MKFSPHNRNHQSDFTLRYSTSEGKLDLIDPKEERIREISTYRRNRTDVFYLPDPKLTDLQCLTTFVYGGFDKDKENAHFSFIQNALYRRIRFVLDLSCYPVGAIEERPRLFVVCKLPGRIFNCCEVAAAGEGQTIKPNLVRGQRYTWKFESFEQMMIGVHWKMDESRLPQGAVASREALLPLVSED